MVTSEPVSSPPRAVAHVHAEAEPLTLGVWLIVIFKGITALLLWGGFVLLLIAGRTNPQSFVAQAMHSVFRGDEPDLAVRFIAQNTQFITKAMVTRLALGLAAYAVVESLEAGGLLLRKPWAEWLVILVTVSFIPFELFEIIARPNPWKVATLIINLVILWYLLRTVLNKRKARDARAAALAADAILHRS